MIKYERLPDDILERIPRAGDLLESASKVVFAYLFGGFAKGDTSPLSDVDIAVYLTEDVDLTAAKLELLGGLVDVLGTDEIDLVLLNTASLPLKARVLDNKRLLADKDPFLRHKYESLTLREYFDFSIKEKAILNRRYGLG